jgi:hypothetical protein
VRVVARLILALLLLVGASRAGGIGGVVAACTAVGAVLSAGACAMPYGRGLREHRQ